MNPNNFNKSYIGLRHDIVQFIEGVDLKILDIGCATGTTGAYLKEQGIASYVEGVEYSSEMGKEAEKFYNKVVIGNLNTQEVFDQFTNRTYDYIIFGDVLEHLIDPWFVLKKVATKHLSSQGRIIISLPNIQHIELLISIYGKGEWPYNERGIFDKTHLRHFTIKNIQELTRSADLVIRKVHRTYRFRDAIGSKFPKFSEKLLTRLFPNLFTFQYIILCESDRQ